MDGLTGVPPLAAAAGLSSSRTRGFRGAWAMVTQTIKLALDALRAHKLRSFLTLLGVILAVTTLVVVMSVVSGLNFYVADKVANLGANVYVLDRFGIITSNDEWIKAQKRPYITMDEFNGLQGGMHTTNQIAALLGTSSDVRSGK